VSTRFGDPLRENGERSRLITLGMGKLGGRELNAGSDVDLIFVYDSDDGAAGDITLHDYWTRVVRRAVQTIDTPSADGLVWRVDLRLRPEGSQGPIVNSLAATERYYETWGRLWERAALLRARAIAGSADLGVELNREVIEPFVFRRAVDPSIATALSELLYRSRAELSSAPERDLKHGPGGIREAEFFVQSLQLIWGGREPSLHVQGTLTALNRLRSRGLVSDREARAIASAYRLLRRVEHAIQWRTGVQTHQLPEDPRELDLLAHTLEHADGKALLREIDAARERVERLFHSLAPSEPRPLSKHHALLRALTDPGADLGPFAAELGGIEVIEHLRAFTQRPDHLLGTATRERHPDLADELLDGIAESPDPEQAARTLRSLLSRFHSPGPWISTLAGDSRALRRFLWVVGGSSFVSDAVIARPELASVVLFGKDRAPEPKVVVEAEVALSAGGPPSDDPWEARDRFVQALRRAKRRVTVEVAVADLGGVLTTRDATRILSLLADETLERAVRFELGAEPKGLAVLAVGKLGGREIGYGSDLDVLFIFDPARAPEDKDPTEHFVRVAQRIIRLISEPSPAGPGYELDTRLRPSGSHGMLVTSLASFARYHGIATSEAGEVGGPAVQSSGAAWERQALIRARACAGDAELAARAMALANVAAYEQGAPSAEEMHRLRLRMEVELGREKAGRFDLKTGRGGLLDIEFATQWLQMRHGLDRRVRTPDTSLALESLVAAGYLDRPEYEIMRDGYVFLRRLEQRIHVLHATSSTVIDDQAAGMVNLARRLGIYDTVQRSAVDELIERYRDVTEAVRSAYLRVLSLTA